MVTQKWVRDYWHELPEMSDEERELVEQSILPAPKEVLIDVVSRYLIHKVLKVDEHQHAMIFKDAAGLLFGMPEYAVTLGVIDLVEDPKVKFFPDVAEMKAAVQKHNIFDSYTLNDKGTLPY